MELLIILISVGYLLLLFWAGEAKGKDTLVRIFSILSIGFLLLVLLSLISYRPLVPTFNLGGTVGYIVSNALIKVLGYFMSYFLIFLLLASSILLLTFRFNRKTFMFVSSLFWGFFWFLVFLSLFESSPFVGSLFVGLERFIRSYLGIAGAVILPLILLTLSFYPALPKLNIRLPRLGSIQKKRRYEEPVEEPLKPAKTEEERQEIPEEMERKKPEPKLTSPGELEEVFNEPVESAEMDEDELRKNAELIEEKLEEFGVRGRVVGYHRGPVVTRYDYEPAPGIKLSRIVALADDLALRMKSNKIRIVAPLPDKGLIGIEVPNKKRKIVYFKELIDTEKFRKEKSILSFALGVTTAGEPYFTDLSKMPHLLIAGATGSGKSVCINSIISSILLKASPEEVRFLLIDPKRIELSYYEGIPHLLRPVVKDRKEAAYALKQAVTWMELRYKHFAKDGVRDIFSHNQTLEERDEEKPLPFIIIIIDEFADLILSAGKEIEESITRLAQMARAVGIHLIVATQRPSVDVITGLIKANFPVRIAFKVPSRVDSKTILDEIGAEKLLGLGDMLYIPPGTAEPIRLHGPFISEEETRKLTQKLTQSYLSYKLKEYLEDTPLMDELADELVKRGFVPALTRSDEPGSDERFEFLVDYVVGRTGMIRDKVKDSLIKLRENYYEEIDEMREAPIPTVSEEEVEVSAGFDPKLEEAARLVVSRGIASATLLQRKLNIGFARAGRIIDQMEKLGIVGPSEGSKPRKVLIGLDRLEEILENLKKSQGI